MAAVPRAVRGNEAVKITPCDFPIIAVWGKFALFPKGSAAQHEQLSCQRFFPTSDL
jgi:hypothetical protein